MNKLNQLYQEQKIKLLKAIDHLEYSYRKIIQLPITLETLDEEMLETWESFAARFSRVSDIFLTKYIRASVLLNDPGYSGSLRDFLDQAEKLGLLEDVNSWMGIRELRNISAHEYTEKDLSIFFERIKQEAPRLINIKSILR